MALDFNSVKFLLWSKNLGASFDRTITLGHQGIGMSCSLGRARRTINKFGISATEAEIELSFQRKGETVLYADQFLHILGAKEVVTVDRSDFEGATLLHDLNQPFPEHLKGTFDMVIDGGTLEHIFDYPKALANCMDLLRVGGHIVSITPASGLMGHGFYQFSPELFFRVFSKDRGFSLRKIIGFDVSKIDSPFFEIIDPAVSNQRTASAGKMPLQLAILAQKIVQTSDFLAPPQQSDYVTIWGSHEKQANKSLDRQIPNPSPTSPTSPTSPIHRLRITLNRYWPDWLRDLRNTWTYRYRWTLSKLVSTMMNRRHFRRLPNHEIFNERTNPETTSK